MYINSKLGSSELYILLVAFWRVFWHGLGSCLEHGSQLQVASSDVLVGGILSRSGEELWRAELHGEPRVLRHLLQAQSLVAVQLQARGDQLSAG